MNFTLDFSITTIIAIIGLILSLYNFFSNLYNNRVRLRIEYISCCYIDSSLAFTFVFENFSRLPITISRLFIDLGSKRYEFQWHSELLEFGLNRNLFVNPGGKFSSLGFPCEITGLGAVSGVFLINRSSLPPLPLKLKNETAQLYLHTSRGKRKTKIVSLSIDA